MQHICTVVLDTQVASLAANDEIKVSESLSLELSLVILTCTSFGPAGLYGPLSLPSIPSGSSSNDESVLTMEAMEAFHWVVNPGSRTLASDIDVNDSSIRKK